MFRLKTLFENKRGRTKVMNIFVTAGYPTLEDTPKMILELEKSGADIIEIGMPFSDPLADGPTIQYSNSIAIENGINLDIIFDMVSEVRSKSGIPIVLMGYINPLLKYGIEACIEKAAKTGVDGFIIPDLPPEESADFRALCQKAGLDFIALVAPNTSDERMRFIDELSTGFVYCVSVTGVTGARSGEDISRSVNRFIAKVEKNIKKNPVLIGFGIKSRTDAVNLSEKTDGFIVGSAVIDAIRKSYPNEDWIKNVSDFVKSLNP